MDSVQHKDLKFIGIMRAGKDFIKDLDWAEGSMFVP